ncbi:putative Response regulator consisting of a CheY-like receiver domain [Rhodospirillaceae bacterium LM-1]|nr:putative Response regulator consisting of a CheY-like receiver domain [Rhodospirillaceae bacterium LM-1]
MFELIPPDARSSIRIMLVEPDVQLRNNLRQALMGANFRNVMDYGTIEKMKPDFDREAPDLLFIDAHTPGGDACELVRNVRFNKGGNNPFMSIVLTVWQTKIEDIEKLVNTGADHIILKPVSPQVMFKRIEALIERRKPFVATSGYIGPDRRRGPRDGTEVPHFHVPNTLKLKAAKRKVDTGQLQKAVDLALGRMNEEMVVRLAFQLAFQAERLAPLAESASKEAPFALKDLKWALMEFMHRIDEENNAQIVRLANTLAETADRIGLAFPGVPEDKEIELLRKLAQAINIGLRSAATPDELASQVNAAIEKSEKRNKAKKEAAAIARQAQAAVAQADAQGL